MSLEPPPRKRRPAPPGTGSTLFSDPSTTTSNFTRTKLTFVQGSNFFRQRLVLSLLSSRPIKIEGIRSTSSDLIVGLLPHEISFIHLLTSISNGTKVKISETGTELSFSPGLISGGVISYTTDPSRSLAYYLEPILLLAPFCKKPLELRLKGRIQNDRVGNNSIYKIKNVGLGIMETFGLEPTLEILSRSVTESEIKFTCNIKKQLLTLRTQYNQDCGKVKKIRGLAYGFRVAPQLLNRIVSSAKGYFLPFLTDVFITVDHPKGTKSKDPGYGLVLWGSTTKGINYGADGWIGKNDGQGEDGAKLATVFQHNLDEDEGKKRQGFRLFPEDDEGDDENGEPEESKAKSKTNKESIIINGSPAPKDLSSITSPEELGLYVANLLLHEILSQSCIDSVFQWLVLGFMALGPKDISSVVMGPLSPYTVQFLRDLKNYFGITFKIDEIGSGTGSGDEEEESSEDDESEENQDASAKKAHLFKLTCLGLGYQNLNKTLV